MPGFGHIALFIGITLSIVVQYQFYIARNRSQRTFIGLAAANLFLLGAASLLGLELPMLIVGILWAGFLSGLAIAIFHDYLPLSQQ